MDMKSESYLPRRKKFICDNNITGPFHTIPYHSALVAMHSFIIYCIPFIYTRLTSGDYTSPVNIEGILMENSQLAIFSWQIDDKAISKAKQYLPTISLAKFPSKKESTSWNLAIQDELNKGVMGEDGKRLSPKFSHHVYDNLYADIPKNFPGALAVSLLSIYYILGFLDGRQPDPFSFDKLVANYNHI